jgi:phage gpG-like protein
MIQPELVQSISGKNAINVDIYITENFTESTAIAEASLHASIPAGMRELGKAIQDSVREEFGKAQKRYKNTWTTTKYKKETGAPGRKVLEETGALKRAVTECRDDYVKVIKTGNSYTLKVEWELPNASGTGLRPELRKNQSFVYLWSHEFGTDETIPQIIAYKGKDKISKDRGFRLIISKFNWGITPAPFFMDGIEKGIDKGTPQLASKISASMDVEGISKRVKPTTYVTSGTRISGTPGKIFTMPQENLATASQIRMPKPVGLGLMPQFFATSFRGGIWYVMPPSKYYAAIGLFSDLVGFIKGGFFSWGIAGNYARNVSLGKAGISKKVIRRRIRGRIWMRD